MRVSARPTIASFRQIISRRFASTEAQNPQVKQAVESASKAYDSALGNAKRVAGPVGEKVGNMLGCEWNVDLAGTSKPFARKLGTLQTSPILTILIYLPITFSTQLTRTLSFTTSKSSPPSPDKSTSPRSSHPLPTSTPGSTLTPRFGRLPSRQTTGRASLKTDSGPRLEFT